MIFNDDWHIHSEHSCDGACMRMEDLVTGAADKGIMDYGITDHIHTQYNFPDIINSRKAYEVNRKPGFHFGVEVSCVSRWEIDKVAAGAGGKLTYGIREGGPAGGELAIAIDEDYIDARGIEYVVAGTHWSMYAGHRAEDLVRDYHRQNMFLSQHRLVDIVAHPWWYYGPCEDGWTTDFGMIPESMHDEFARSCIENNKLVEINLAAMLLAKNYSDKFKREYMEYLVFLKEAGVRFSIGSDCHNEFYNLDMQKASDMLGSAGFEESDFHSPVPRVL
ncbi:MAG: PHP domain-containing protein [Clostridia bacterium]|nr:PHP domain-containing protein [Clostridia bacterium]